MEDDTRPATNSEIDEARKLYDRSPQVLALIARIDDDRAEAEKTLLLMCDEHGRAVAAEMEVADLRAEAERLRATTAAIVRWLEDNHPDVFKRGLWDAIHAAKAAMKEK